jgi:large subunit ribosomal protein L29
MKISEIRDQSIEDLLEKRRELKQEAFNLRLQQLENPARLTIIRKDVARIETTLTGKRAAASAQ